MSILLQVLSNADRYGIELSELAKTSPGTALAELLKLLAQKHGRVIILVDEYDGFSFDGVHGVYNPFSTLSFLKWDSLITSGLRAVRPLSVWVPHGARKKRHGSYSRRPKQRGALFHGEPLHVR